MEKQKLRNQIDNKYKWDLTRIYKTDEEFYKELELFKNKIDEIKKYEGKLFSNNNILEDYINLDEQLDKLSNKLSEYASLKNCEDQTNIKYQEMITALMDTYSKYQNETSFFDEEFYKTDYNKIQQLLEKSDKLKSYKLYFDRLNRYREHYLSKEQEKIVNQLTRNYSSNSQIYDMLTDSEMKFGNIIDEDNNKIELTQSNFSKYIMSNNRNVRKNAFNKIYKTFENYKNTISLTYLNNVDNDINLIKIYKYNSTLEKELFDDNIDISLYNNLIESVHNKLDILYEYFEYKRKLLKLDKIHLYDLYTKTSNDIDKNYSFEQSKEIVLKALNVMGEDYLKQANYIFNNNLIDVYNNVGKTGGAFSSGNFDTDPYILLNFEGKYNDISTIAHELGHSIHTRYSCSNNIRPYSNYRIFVAEIASTVNELLLASYMYNNTKDNNEKKYILNQLLDNIKATIYRQTMFAEFEKIVYDKREAEIPLSSESLNKIYYDLNKLYFGKNVIVDKKISYEWERIPHFYRAFYVYKYATSLSISMYISDKIINGDTKFRDKYIEFLKLGDTKYPLDEIKTLGIDFEKDKIIDKALDKFGELFNKFKELNERM